MAKERFDLEAMFHLTLHLVLIIGMFWVVIYIPVWMAILIMALEIAQMKYFGRCILTVWAHRRGYMKGKTYWQYVPYLLGVKDYKKADKIISTSISLALLGILILRLVL